jgi:predicted transcriptional regulator
LARIDIQKPFETAMGDRKMTMLSMLDYPPIDDDMDCAKQPLSAGAIALLEQAAYRAEVVQSEGKPIIWLSPIAPVYGRLSEVAHELLESPSNRRAVVYAPVVYGQEAVRAKVVVSLASCQIVRHNGQRALKIVTSARLGQGALASFLRAIGTPQTQPRPRRPRLSIVQPPSDAEDTALIRVGYSTPTSDPQLNKLHSHIKAMAELAEDGVAWVTWEDLSAHVGLQKSRLAVLLRILLGLGELEKHKSGYTRACGYSIGKGQPLPLNQNEQRILDYLSAAITQRRGRGDRYWCQLSEIAANLNIGPATITPALQALIGRGLLIRETNGGPRPSAFSLPVNNTMET